jgi:hypothetical protein
VAKSFGDRTAIRALLAAWSELSQAVLRWDVLASICDRVLPIRFEGNRWVGPSGPLPQDARWAFGLPRASAASNEGHVVAVRLGPLRLAVSEAARSKGIKGSSGAAWRCWSELTARAGALMDSVIADHGVAVFPSAAAAFSFARAARSRLGGGRELPLGPLQQPMSLPSGIIPPIGIASGEVLGGHDGETASFGGRAVAEAIFLAGNGRVDRIADDPFGVRRVGYGGAGLGNDGVAASRAFLAALLSGVERAGTALHRAGETTRVAGVAADFTSWPVPAWWEIGEEVVMALPLEAGSAQGPVELAFLTRDTFTELARADADRARRSPSAASAAGRPSGACPGGLTRGARRPRLRADDPRRLRG